MTVRGLLIWLLKATLIVVLFARLLNVLLTSAYPKPGTSNEKQNSSGSGSSSSSKQQSKPSSRNSKNASQNNGYNSHDDEQSETFSKKPKSSEQSKPSSGNTKNDSRGKNTRHDDDEHFHKSGNDESVLQAAFRYFEIKNPQEATWQDIKKKYRRLSLIHHPDRNNQSEDSVKEMQKINRYYELLEQEFERGGGNRPTFRMPRKSPHTNKRSDQGHSSDTEPAADPNEPGISREEYKRRRNLKKKQQQKAAKRARAEAKREEEEKKRWEEQYQKDMEEWARKERQEEKQREWERKQEEKRRRKEREQEMREAWKEAKRKMKEFQKQQKETRKMNDLMMQELKLHTKDGRAAAYRRWKQEVESIREQLSGSDHHGKPRNPIMEYSNKDIALALKLGATEIAIELVHEFMEQSFIQNIRKALLEKFKKDTSVPPELSKEEVSKIYKSACTHVLCWPLDEDDNTVLHYAVYHEDDFMLTFLVTQARRSSLFSNYFTRFNGRGSTILDFCVGSSNTAFCNRVEALYEEARNEQRYSAQSWYNLQQVLDSCCVGSSNRAFRKRVRYLGEEDRKEPRGSSVFARAYGYLESALLTVFDIDVLFEWSERAWLMSQSLISKFSGGAD